MNVEEAKSFLISRGKNPDLDEDGRQEFHWAVDEGNVDEVKAWIAFGMSVDTKHDDSYPIIRAAEGNSPEMVELLCELGADLSVRDRDGDTALHTAVNWDHEEVLKALIAKGSPLDTTNGAQDTPLLGAMEQHPEFVEVLLEAGADPNYGSSYGCCPLEQGILHGHGDLLIAKGADPNLVVDGQTVLCRAAMQDEAVAIDFLLANGADVDKPNAFGWTPAMIAARTDGHCVTKFEPVDHPLVTVFKEVDNFETVKKVVADLGPDLLDENGASLLMHVTAEGRQDLVELLIEAGADVNVCDGDGENAVSIAAGANYDDILKMLFKVGANPNDSNGQCKALIDAALMSAVDATKMLLENGANPSSHNKYHDSALHQAIYEAPIELIRMLLEAGATPDCMNHIGTSPLAYAVDQYRPNVVALLLDFGADPDYADSDGKTALSEAVSMSYNYTKKLSKCIDVLLSRGADPSIRYFGSTAYESALNYDYDDAAEQILTHTTTSRLDEIRKSTDSDDAAIATLAKEVDGHAMQMWIRKDPKIAMKLLALGAASGTYPGFSPLYAAMDIGADDVVSAMLEVEIDPNGTGTHDQDVLSLAAQKGRVDWVKQLIEKGANLDGVKGYNPLTAAAGSGSLECIEALLEAGANPNPVPAGVSPLMRAAVEGHKEICERLIEAGADKNVKNRAGDDAAAWASSKDHQELATFLGG